MKKTLNAAQKKLVKKALEARKKAYAPYSNFRVGSAIEAADGKIFVGCNVEDAAYSTTCCAERVALFSAVSAGKRKFKRIAVASDADGACPPCGTCRQALMEFARDMEVIMASPRGHTKVMRLADLLPEPFHSLR